MQHLFVLALLVRTDPSLAVDPGDYDLIEAIQDDVVANVADLEGVAYIEVDDPDYGPDDPSDKGSVGVDLEWKAVDATVVTGTPVRDSDATATATYFRLKRTQEI